MAMGHSLSVHQQHYRWADDAVVLTAQLNFFYERVSSAKRLMGSLNAPGKELEDSIACTNNYLIVQRNRPWLMQQILNLDFCFGLRL